MTANDDSEAMQRQVEDLFHDAATDLFSEALVATGGDRGKADDLVQQVFHDLLRAWGTVGERNRSGQRAWLYAVLRNKVVDAYRRGTREVAMGTAELGQLGSYTPHVLSTTRSPLLAAVLDQCWAVIKGMPPVRQRVFWLRAHEWKTTEIAAQLMITPSTVRDHYQQGIRQLNAMIGPAHEIFDGLEDNEFEDEAE